MVRRRVTLSQTPLLVKIGVRSWNANRVPVGSRLARWAVLASICESPCWENEGARVSVGGAGGSDCWLSSWVFVAAFDVAGEPGGGCCEVVEGRCLRLVDMFGGFGEELRL
ncbi:hypothetical protein Droror1_Dr00013951 [Drosera rotundifolia]